MRRGERLKKVSVIMIVTNSSQSEEALKWIKNQTISADTECIFMNNYNNCNFTSAARALNCGADQANGEVLVFMHQDVYLWDSQTLEKYYQLLIDSDTALIAGLAGRNHDSDTISDLYETDQHIHRAIWGNGKTTEVEAVDECMFGMKKELWNKLRFNEDVCDNWHCYATEICIHNRIEGGKNVVLPCKACHESIGNAKQIGFIHTVKKMINKYNGKVKYITSCCITIRCTWLAYYLYAMKYYIRNMLKRSLGYNRY